ncbi:MAG: molybdopterin-dependent oxidoreductase [SAR324 cluster bacterium]|nr:molybdopterin-dependent oxidoreductase [SAR324 cluster bacterium]
MPTFYLDNEPIEFEPGENVLAAALRHHREIPHYCYHPGLQVTAQCRMCLVDVVDMGNGRGMPKLQTSCSTAAAEGMKVDSQSEKVKHGQILVNEFLLINHPLDCPICDQAGECDLQDFSFKYGSGQSEMEYEKRVYGLRDVGTFIVLERNRCIHCSRCERFTRDVTGTHDFGMFLRTHELTFDTFEDHQITDKFQGNLADICPVGCIMNRDWRFKKRAWKLNKTESICPSCSTGCNITVEHHKNRVFRLKPRENQEVNRWWMCDEGRIGFKQLNDRVTRLAEPQARVKGQLRSVVWETAYEAIVTRLKEIGATGAQAFGIIDTHATNEEMHLFKKLMQEGLGAETVYFPLRRGEQQVQPPREDMDPFIYTLIQTDKSPNTRGALAQGLTGDEDDKRLLAALQAEPKVAVICGAPLEDNAAVCKAAAKAELVIQLGTFRGPWTEVADVVLPGYTYAEKQGSFTNKADRVQRINAGIRPAEGARDQVRIIQELLAALGKPQKTVGAPGVFDAMASEQGAFKGMSWDKLGSLGGVLPGK